MNIARITVTAAAAVLFAAAPVLAQRQTYDYRMADSVALAAPANAASVEEIAAKVTRGLHSDRDKARAIYRWITHNIEYDASAFFGSRFMVPVQTPPAVLRRKRAVCDGFSLLFMAMSHAAGLEVGEVSGYAKAYSGDPRNPVSRQRHAWNVVRVDGAWQLVDASWGAGDIIGRDFVRRFRDFYFFPDPEKFIYSHMAEDPAMQLLAHPVSVSQFDRMPALQRDFWELGFSPADVRNASAAGREFVGVFPVAQHPIRVTAAPLAARLVPGAMHRFRIEAPGATEVFAVSGTQWQPLAPAGETAAGGAAQASAPGTAFTGDAALTGPELVLLVRYPEAPAGIVVLRYGSAAATARRGRRGE
ncbi:transglutaminase domain-containing protein [Longimicrobium terrae]|uniref:Transglutaminase-like domain-containing protein n=1 Tax=Longimicrobium terrae TaxID=1639882 RepID=A0A841H2A3_9BACT|nr:transglutaminase domain-containing protein [Longimicrobium terrae]MBB4637705.1 hypothetical protein [Longimicrobium terrae]MBB6072102.1 hypothetical protein [Longimicrobium terrae]NNC29815.1 hypothetical protein [Longimicrobium terrae]